MSRLATAPVIILPLAAPALAGVTVTVEPIPPVPYAGAAAPIGFGFDGNSLFGGVYPALDENIAPYRWTAAGGYQLLPAGGFLGSEFSDAALDTTSIVGLRYEPPAKSGSSHPVIRWLPSGPLHGNPIVGGLSVPGTWEYRPVVSGNGKVILRTYREPTSLDLYGNVFAWTADQPQWIERGGYPAPAGADDYPAWVLDVDGSGSTFVGNYSTSYAAIDPYGPGSRRPFVYRNGAFATLPVPTSSLDGFAEKISSNGRMILGRTTDGLTQYLWRRSTPTGPFTIASIPVPPGGSTGRIRNFTYNGRLGFGTYRNAAAQTRTMIWRDTGGAIDGQGWIDGLGLPALGWTGFVPDSFSDDGRTVLGTAISGGVTQRVRVRGYDLAALLGPTPSLGEFATSPIVMTSSTLSSVTLDTRLFMEGRPQDAVAGNDLRDGWYSWTAPSSGIAATAHCPSAGSAESQVTLAVYRADGVRIAAGGAGSHPGCATPNGARVQFGAIAGTTYRIRVSLADAQLGHDTYGTAAAGLVTVLNPEPTCGAAGAGGCLVAHLIPGCADEACCLTVCAADPFCCDNQWDLLCVDAAADGCGLTSGDLNGDGEVNAADLAILLAGWGSTGPNPADLNGNGTVDATDLGILLANWG